MKIIFLFLLLLSYLDAEQRPVDCNKVFELRKSELLKEIEKIDEETEAFDSLKSATNAMLDKKQAKLDAKSAKISEELQSIADKEKNIKTMLVENKKMLEMIKEAKDDKIAATYSKMKAGAAGEILNKLTPAVAAGILFNLKPKKMATVIAKMTPEKAATVTKTLSAGPPFIDTNSTQEIKGK